MDWNRAAEVVYRTIAKSVNAAFSKDLTVYLSLKGADGKPCYGLFLAGPTEKLKEEQTNRILSFTAAADSTPSPTPRATHRRGTSG